MLDQFSGWLSWEIAPGIKKAQAFVVSPELDLTLEPFTEYFFSVAPKYPGWEFYNWRPRRSAEYAARFMKEALGWPDADKTAFRLFPGEFNQLNFEVIASSKLKKAAKKAGFPEDHLVNLLISMLVGERAALCWLKAPEIDCQNRPKAPESFVSINGFEQHFIAQTARVQSAFSEQPLYTKFGTGERVVFNTNAPPPGSKQYALFEDLVAGNTVAPFILDALNGGGPFFFSERYVSSGELFVWLGYEHAEPLATPEIADARAEFEEIAHQTLVNEEAGCVIGGATGNQYVYVFCALGAVTPGIDILLQAARKHNVARSSWLTFIDGALAREWHGVWPDSPERPEILWFRE